MRAVASMALSILIVLAMAGGALFFGQRTFIYPAPRDRLADPPPGYRFIEFRTSDGLTLRAAFRPAADGKPTLVFFHGNGDSIAGASVATQMLTQAGAGALLVEYRGYGGNPGSPNEHGLYLDAEAAISWLQQQGIRPEQLVVIGNSIGSGPATEMALRHRPAALILISPFASLPHAVAGAVPLVPAFMVRDRFDNVSKIGRIVSPTLVLHGADDRLIRPDNARLLQQAAPNLTLVMVAGKGHELAYDAAGQGPALAWLEQRLGRTAE